MKPKVVVAALLAAVVAACGQNRGGVADAVLDRTLYQADTKAERLLRAYEIQALLVRYAALFGGSGPERNTIAGANVVATGRLNEVFNCLHYGSLQADKAVQMKEATNAPIRATHYCSFFDSRMLSYEAALINLMRQATSWDEDVAELRQLIAGLSVTDLLTVATRLVTLAERVARDAHLVAAFKADVRELQFLVWQQIPGPESVDPNHGYGGVRPERDGPETVERALRAKNLEPSRPTVLVWHFQEVSAFLRDSCIALNDNAEIKDFPGTRCASRLPFLEDGPAALRRPVEAGDAALTAAVRPATPEPVVVPAAK